MARPARYTETIGPTKLTPTQKARLEAEEKERPVSIADLVRDALDARYGLVDGQERATA